MTTLALLQNQWARNPEEMRRVRNRVFRRDGLEGVDDFNKRLLFGGCKTGRMIAAVFSKDEIGKLTFVEASPVITGRSDGNPGFDTSHIALRLMHYQPQVVIAFGKVAKDGLAAVYWPEEKTIFAPHPAGRTGNIKWKLNCARMQWGGRKENATP